MGFSPRLIGALFTAFCAIAAHQVAAENLYRYRADNGVLVVDFHVPVEYADNGYEVLDANGVVVSVVPRAMTAEERANVALSRELEEDAKSEQQRLQNWDESLLLRYSTIADIEDARDRSLSDLKIRVSILKSNRRSLQHADLIRPKFEIAYKALRKMDKDYGNFSEPTGGYFITFISKKSIASRIVELCKEAGVLLTAAGATFPYGKDPNDNTLRIAPTFIDEKELEVAMDVFITAVQIAHEEA